jgi:hypothetical protein
MRSHFLRTRVGDRGGIRTIRDPATGTLGGCVDLVKNTGFVIP